MVKFKAIGYNHFSLFGTIIGTTRINFDFKIKIQVSSLFL